MRLTRVRGVPCAGEALGVGELVWIHLARNPVSTMGDQFPIAIAIRVVSS